MVPGKKRITILYVDDSAFEREVVGNFLEAEGYEVMTSGDPLEGIELARGKAPDLILLDLHMPGMDGNAVVGRMREIPALREVPIVALSATIDGGDQAVLCGMFDGFLGKPIDADAFPAQVRGFISRRRGETGGGADPLGSVKKRGGGEEGDPAAADDPREALEALERIRSALSHDLRSPLTVMISYAGTVGRRKAGELSERQSEMLDLVVEQGFKMDELIAELALIARETLERYGYPPK